MYPLRTQIQCIDELYITSLQTRKAIVATRKSRSSRKTARLFRGAASGHKWALRERYREQKNKGRKKQKKRCNSDRGIYQADTKDRLEGSVE